MLIVAGRARTDGFLAQARIEGVLVQFGKLLQQSLGPGLRGQNAAHGGQGEGAEVDGALQGRQHIITLVMRHQRQQLLGLQLALDLLGQEPVEELGRDGTQLAEAFSFPSSRPSPSPRRRRQRVLAPWS